VLSQRLSALCPIPRLSSEVRRSLDAHQGGNWIVGAPNEHGRRVKPAVRGGTISVKSEPYGFCPRSRSVSSPLNQRLVEAVLLYTSYPSENQASVFLPV
jgi:hypothetical protein